MSSPTLTTATPISSEIQIAGMKRTRLSMEGEEEDNSNTSTTPMTASPDAEETLGSPHKKTRRLEASTTLRSETELQAFLNGEHPLLRPGKNADDFSAVLIVHCKWNKPQFSIPETVHRYNALTTTFQMTALPSLSVFCVDVDAIGVEETSDMLELVTYPLPAMLMYRFTPYQSNSTASSPTLPLAAPKPKRQATKMIEKSLWEQRNDEEAMLKVIRSASLVEPVHSLDHFQDRLQRQPDDTYTILWYSASWCPPCRRVGESMPEIITRVPNNVVQIVKADKDQTQGMYDHFGVQKIPTFEIFKNGPNVQRGFTAKGSLQNSQATQVISFIDQNCATLKFDLDDEEDF